MIARIESGVGLAVCLAWFVAGVMHLSFLDAAGALVGMLLAWLYGQR